MKTYNYRLLIEGKVVAESEEDGQTLLAQSVQQFVQVIKPGKIEAHVLDGPLPVLGEIDAEPGGLNVYLDLVGKVGEVIANSINRVGDRLEAAVAHGLSAIAPTENEEQAQARLEAFAASPPSLGDKKSPARRGKKAVDARTLGDTLEGDDQ